jgi:hypothetical protein
MSLKQKLRQLFSVRIADISGVGSAAATAAPATSLHEPRPTTTSAPVRPDPAEPDPEE